LTIISFDRRASPIRIAFSIWMLEVGFLYGFFDAEYQRFNETIDPIPCLLAIDTLYTIDLPSDAAPQFSKPVEHNLELLHRKLTLKQAFTQYITPIMVNRFSEGQNQWIN